jgi:hypothetical protein
MTTSTTLKPFCNALIEQDTKNGVLAKETWQLFTQFNKTIKKTADKKAVFLQ